MTCMSLWITMWKWGISFELMRLMIIIINKILKEKCIKNEKILD